MMTGNEHVEQRMRAALKAREDRLRAGKPAVEASSEPQSDQGIPFPIVLALIIFAFFLGAAVQWFSLAFPMV